MWSRTRSSHEVGRTVRSHFEVSRVFYVPSFLLLSTCFEILLSLPIRSIFPSFPPLLLTSNRFGLFLLLFLLLFSSYTLRSFWRRKLSFHFIKSFNCIFYLILYDLSSSGSIFFLLLSYFTRDILSVWVTWPQKSCFLCQASRACTLVSHSHCERSALSRLSNFLSSEISTLIGVAQILENSPPRSL